jgi:VWFA-related protein
MLTTAHAIRRWGAAAASILAVATTVSLVAQGAQSAQDAVTPQQPVFRSGVDAVTVDVTVIDKDGKPVRDLTMADFEIREAGKLQTVTAFKLIETNDGLDDPRATRDILSFEDHRIEAARADNRLFVVFLDDYHVRRENGMRVREQLSAFLAQLSPHDLVAIATPFSSVAGLTFSRSHTGLSSHVLNFEGRKYDYTPRNAMEERYQNLPIQQQEQMRNSIVISALSNISEYLGTIREGRKTIVYVSEGMSGSLPAGVMVTSPQGFGRTQTGPSGNGRDSFSFFENSSLLQEISSKVFLSASRNNVAIYTLDPRGLTNFEYGVGENVTASEDRRLVQETSDMLRVIADETGGRAIVGRNDPIPALRQMVDDSRTYYLLGYTSTEAPRDGRFHPIQVRVKRNSVDVRARKGYWAYTAEEVARATAPSKPAAPAEVTDALDELASVATPGRGRAVAVWLGAVRGVAEQARVTLAWEAVSAAATASALDAVDRVTIVATTLSGKDVFSGTVPKAAALGKPGGTISFDAPAGPLRVRFTAENAKGVRIENEEAALDVPDFTGTGPQITVPFLYRGRTARDIQQIRAAENPSPVVMPIFSRTERVLIRFGAYAPAGTTPKVSMRLLNQQGAALANLPSPSPNAGGALESELGLGAFPPGDYLVEIVAESAGEKIKRVIGLRVTG